MKERKFRIRWNQGPYRFKFFRGACGGWVIVIGGLVFSRLGEDE